MAGFYKTAFGLSRYEAAYSFTIIQKDMYSESLGLVTDVLKSHIEVQNFSAFELFKGT